MKRNLHSGSIAAAVITIAMLLTGCAYYSFSGATIPSHLETIAVPLAENRAGGSLPGLDDELTRLLTNRFVSRTRLALSRDETSADVVLQSRIESYTTRPTSVTGANQAALNQVTIRVHVRYYDQRRDSVLMEQDFTSFEEYDPRRGLAGEGEAASAALETLASDIFTAATSNW